MRRAVRSSIVAFAFAAGAVLPCGAQTATPAVTTASPVMAQTPLLVRPTAEATPNVMLTIDDSGSMVGRVMPDTAYGTDILALMVYTFHHGDPRDAVLRYSPTTLPYIIGTGTDLWTSRLRSSAVNTIYYNPAVRYRPWARADGTTFPEADASAARRDPLLASPVLDLRGEQTVAGQAIWCRSNPLATALLQCVYQSNQSYAPATYYEWSGDPGAGGTATRVRIMDADSYLRPATRTDCEVSGAEATCTREQEYQNFANWFVYHRTRLYAAIAGVSHALATRQGGMRLGYGLINGGTQVIDGVAGTVVQRGVRPFTGSDRSAMFDWLHAIRAPYGTPLHEALHAVGTYFSRTDAGSPWAQDPSAWETTPQPGFSACRASYHILFTDGAWNGSVPAALAGKNIDGTDGDTLRHADGVRSWTYRATAPWSDSVANTLADVASYYYQRDLQPDIPNAVPTAREGAPFWQGLVTYTMGFGVAGTLDPTRDLPALTAGTKSWPDPALGGKARIDDLWHAALDSGGSYINALDANSLQKALSDLLDAIRPAESASTAGIALAGRTLDAGSRKYVPSYRAGDWTGDLRAYAVTAAGATDPTPIWSAADRLPAAAQRNLWTWKPAAGASAAGAVAFNWDALVVAGLSTSFGDDASAPLIDYLRGDRTGEGPTWRRRTGLLGDIVSSQPLRLKEGPDLQYQFLPAAVPGGSTYPAFRRAKAARAGLLLFGANDGFLHALREDDGVEVFGFLPAAVQPTVRDLGQVKFAHRFYVDGPVIETDVYAGKGAGWRNLVVASTGAGARSVFALDATDFSVPGAKNILWELGTAQAPRLGHVIAPPDAGPMADGSWAVVLGNGPGGEGGFAQLIVVDAMSGRVLRTLDAETGSGTNGLGGVRLVRNASNVVVAAYAGDLAGRIWRFDLQDTDPSKWRVAFDGQPLYAVRDGARTLPVTAAPEYVEHPKGGQVVLVGTGRLFEAADADDTGTQALLGLWDTQPAATPATSSMLRIADDAAMAIHRWSTVTSTTAAGAVLTWDTIVAADLDWTRQRGWRLPLEGGLRDIHGPRFERGFARFSPVKPAPVGVGNCTLGSASGLDLQLQPLTGLMSTRPIFDTNGDGVVDGADLLVAGVRTTGEGPGAVASRSGGGDGASCLLDSRDGCVALGYPGIRAVRAWRQIVNPPR